MTPLQKRLADLKDDFQAAYDRLKITDELKKIQELEEVVSKPEIWNNPTEAGAKNEQLASLNNLVQPWQTLQVQLQDLSELIDLGDDSLEPEFETQIAALNNDFAALKKSLLLTGEYDKNNAILRLTSGVGGLDAQDFTEMLERMYLRWAEKENLKTTILERQKSEEAGIKTSVIEVKGPFAYGRLKSENGVHRLVRLSPFNSDNLRQTSFALVEILPELAPEKVNLDPKDLKIDVYRSGGKGGQSVNTTDSAVRITHIPTGITVSIQNERSQLQNKENALKILASKLAQLAKEQHAQDLSELRAGKSADWGSQIRNYVLHPYTLVKDTRTKYEETDVEKVLNGSIDGFINAYLEANLKT